MQTKTGLVFDPAGVTRLVNLIEETIKEASEQGIVIDDEKGARRLVCKRVLAAIESGESDPAKLKQIALASGLH